MFASFLRRLRLAMWRRKYWTPPRPNAFSHLPPYRDARQAGFTLIELMVTIGIIGLLAAIALPAYASFANKAAASEGIRIADGAETAVSESYSDSGTVPGNSAEAGFIEQTGMKYVGDIHIAGAGQIVVTYSATAPSQFANSVLVFTPYTTTDNTTLAWVCGYATPQAGWTALAPDAAGQGNAAPATNIAPAYLPKACRAGG